MNHSHLSAYSVSPANIAYTEEQLAGGTVDIVFPKIVPKEQVTISYLYFPPEIWSDIQGSVKSDDGFAKIIQVLPSPQIPQLLSRVLWLFISLGAVSFVYLVIQLITWIATLTG